MTQSPPCLFALTSRGLVLASQLMLLTLGSHRSTLSENKAAGVLVVARSSAGAWTHTLGRRQSRQRARSKPLPCTLLSAPCQPRTYRHRELELVSRAVFFPVFWFGRRENICARGELAQNRSELEKSRDLNIRLLSLQFPHSDPHPGSRTSSEGRAHSTSYRPLLPPQCGLHSVPRLSSAALEELLAGVSVWNLAFKT